MSEFVIHKPTLGFVAGNGNTLVVVSNNPTVTWLHVVLALAMLYLGFGARDTATA